MRNPGTFGDIVETCDGMLAPQTYRKIYEMGLTGGLIVEVGTAMGAATAALAMGLKDSGKPGRIYTFDPMSGGPRQHITDIDARVDRIRNNLAKYDVADLVEIVPLDLKSGLHILPTDQQIEVLMLDADGRIDRDLNLLNDRILEDCMLIIDDVADKVKVFRKNGAMRVDSKLRLSYLLVDMLKKKGFITDGQLIAHTYFGQSLNLRNFKESDSAVIAVYRELVFQDTHMPLFESIRKTSMRNIQSYAPDLAAKMRRVYRSMKHSH